MVPVGWDGWMEGGREGEAPRGGARERCDAVVMGNETNDIFLHSIVDTI